MPLYDYQCVNCKHVVEVRHGFDDAHEGVCPKCGGAMTRVFNAAPILFKGSGFYVTDSRPKSSASGDSKPAAPASAPAAAPATAPAAATAPAKPSSDKGSAA
jgi:putative FmdB family regulatory protein